MVNAHQPETIETVKHHSTFTSFGFRGSFPFLSKEATASIGDGRTNMMNKI
ncbi:MAG: hypothetical protein BSOLF_0410 [Candidatus Carbobacillus altaicus]|uniref:Uncharacterized protein n=1 Tax=Candidatus Carbonibacillus altaicus TaxID=2163959 RepID=A0A2R6Y5F2_9BACL|nr:MAG: hypothetical protein BSOLF_0410 [Candidatus Carbobacillus altaicus]